MNLPQIPGKSTAPNLAPEAIAEEAVYYVEFRDSFEKSVAICVNPWIKRTQNVTAIGGRALCQCVLCS